jgi:hypothetical protein
MKAFLPFKSAENALSVINDVSEGILHEDLKNFLEANLPKVKKGSKNAGFHLGVNEPKLGNSITEQMSVPCKIDEAVTELMRGVRLHFSKLIKGLKDGDVKQAQLVYTCFNPYPSTWDSQFRAAMVSYLASEIALPLAGDKKFGMAMRRDNIAVAKSKIEQARIRDGNEGFYSSDLRVDWMAARWTTRWKPAVGFGSPPRSVTRPARSLSKNSVRSRFKRSISTPQARKTPTASASSPRESNRCSRVAYSWRRSPARPRAR